MADGYTEAERLLLSVQVAASRFASVITTLRQLLNGVQSSHQLPAGLREHERRLGKLRVAQARAAASEFKRTAPKQFEQRWLSAQPADAEAGRAPATLLPLEVHIAAALARLGPAFRTDVLEQLLTDCGNKPDVAQYAFEYLQWLMRDDDADVLRKSLIPTLISAAEDLLSVLIWTWRYTRLADASVTGSENAEHIAKAYRAVYNASGRGPKNWAKVLREEVELDVPAILGERWPPTCEVFERRNVVVHHQGRVSERYLQRLSDAPDLPPLGTILISDRAYMDRSLQLLENLADVVAVGFAARLAPADNQTREFAHSPVYRALRAGFWREAEVMAAAALADAPSDHEHHELRINQWLAQRELGTIGQEAMSLLISEWSPPVDQPRFRLAIAALLGDVPQAIASLQQCLDDDPVGSYGVREWPVVTLLAERSTEFQRALRLGSAQASKRRSQAERRGGRRDQKRR
jgi:hypothetical protein